MTVMPESDQNAAHPITFSRRAVLKTLGASVGAVAVWPYLSDEAAEAFARIQETRAAPAPVFLTPSQYATVERLTETIGEAEREDGEWIVREYVLEDSEGSFLIKLR